MDTLKNKGPVMEYGRRNNYTKVEGQHGSQTLALSKSFDLHAEHIAQSRKGLICKLLMLLMSRFKLTLSLPQMTKTEFLLTISIQYQAGK